MNIDELLDRLEQLDPDTYDRIQNGGFIRSEVLRAIEGHGWRIGDETYSDHTDKLQKPVWSKKLCYDGVRAEGRSSIEALLTVYIAALEKTSDEANR